MELQYADDKYLVKQLTKATENHKLLWENNSSTNGYNYISYHNIKAGIVIKIVFSVSRDRLKFILDLYTFDKSIDKSILLYETGAEAMELHIAIIKQLLDFNLLFQSLL